MEDSDVEDLIWLKAVGRGVCPGVLFPEPAAFCCPVQKAIQGLV